MQQQVGTPDRLGMHRESHNSRFDMHEPRHLIVVLQLPDSRQVAVASPGLV